MISAALLQAFGLGLVGSLSWGRGVRADSPFNNPPGVDIWCGKAYREIVCQYLS
jgi:hypothetical protein